MADTRSTEQRRRIMQSVGQKDTGPEMTVRRMAHALGYRYRLHVKGMPGKPDLVFPSRKKVIFVHGCFWHGHGCQKGRLPKSRPDYWVPKIEANRVRDAAAEKALADSGWTALTIWQCEIQSGPDLAARLVTFLGPRGEGSSPSVNDES